MNTRLSIATGLFMVSASAYAQMDDGGRRGDNGYDAIRWFFPCPISSTLPVPAAAPGEVVLKGEGPFTMDREYTLGTKVYVTGEICEATKLRRDIVFAIDRSGSMYDGLGRVGNDPLKDGTCGRKKALEAVLAATDFTTTNVGLLMFSEPAHNVTRKLYSSQAELLNDVTSNGRYKVEDIVCAGEGGTAYQPALNAAVNLFRNSGTSFATKEIFLITDGRPDNDNEHGIRALVRKLQTEGFDVAGKKHFATLATIRLGPTDIPLLTEIASRDVNGTALYAAADKAEDLAKALREMAEKNKLEGSNVSYGGDDGQTPTVIDVMPHVQNWRFELDPFALNHSRPQSKYGVALQYWDTHMNRFILNGMINWQ